jgi:hypothetical protein
VPVVQVVFIIKPLYFNVFIVFLRLSGQTVGTASVVADHSKASGLVEVFDLIVPTFYRVSEIPSKKSSLSS